MNKEEENDITTMVKDAVLAVLLERIGGVLELTSEEILETNGKVLTIDAVLPVGNFRFGIKKVVH